jgi:hypothetical protein
MESLPNPPSPLSTKDLNIAIETLNYHIHQAKAAVTKQAEPKLSTLTLLSLHILIKIKEKYRLWWFWLHTRLTVYES